VTRKPATNRKCGSDDEPVCLSADYREVNRNRAYNKLKENMNNTKFVVKLNRVGGRGAEYVQRIDRTPVQTTTNRKLALTMGRFTAEDVVKAMQTSRCNPELVSVVIHP